MSIRVHLSGVRSADHRVTRWPDGSQVAGLGPSWRRASATGFTLIEVVVVVVVIALLAGLVAPNVFRNLGMARESTAQSQAAMLAAALDTYRLDNGRYPATEQGLEALWTRPQGGPVPRNWTGPYLRRPPPLDPWDNPYVYTLDEEGRFHLRSYGADGEEGGTAEAADVVLW